MPEDTITDREGAVDTRATGGSPRSRSGSASLPGASSSEELREAQRQDAGGGTMGIPHAVSQHVVVSALQLHGEPRLRALEVEDEAGERVLTTKAAAHRFPS